MRAICKLLPSFNIPAQCGAFSFAPSMPTIKESKNEGKYEPLRDPSTGVFSREAFVQFGSLMVSQAVRRNFPLGVLVVGLDDSVAIEQDGTSRSSLAR